MKNSAGQLWPQTDEEISATAAAIVKYKPGKAEWKAGDQDRITVNGASWAVRLVHVGPWEYVGRVAQKPVYRCGLLSVDEGGNYWFTFWKKHVHVVDGQWTEAGRESLVYGITGNEALRFIARETVTDEHLREEMQRAVASPLFEFMAEVPQTTKAKRARRKKQPQDPFAVQLEMATALVGLIGGLEKTATPDGLAEARRTVSKLFKALHSEDAFKFVTAA